MGKSDQVLSSFPLPPSGKVIEKNLNNSGIYLITFILNFFFFSGNHGLTRNTAPDRFLVHYT